VRQHGWKRAAWLAPRCVRTTLRSFKRRDARCVGPTSAFSRSSYEYSCLVGSRLHRNVLAHATPIRGDSPASRQSDSLRRATRSCGWAFFFPAARRVSRTSDTPVAIPVECHRSRGRRTCRKPPRPFSTCSRKRCKSRGDPRCLSSFKDLCPAAPFQMPGSGRPQVHGLAAVTLFLVTSFAYARLLRAANARPPSACPVAVGSTLL